MRRIGKPHPTEPELIQDVVQDLKSSLNLIVAARNAIRPRQNYKWQKLATTRHNLKRLYEKDKDIESFMKKMGNNLWTCINTGVGRSDAEVLSTSSKESARDDNLDVSSWRQQLERLDFSTIVQPLHQYENRQTGMTKKAQEKTKQKPWLSKK